ncbi:MAG: murein L,D-transpeptidase catalytic domain family protein [Thermaurantiacus sp.]
MRSDLTRRGLFGGLLAIAAAPALAGSEGCRLAQLARDVLERHGAVAQHRDVVGIADFSQPSRRPRFFIVDVTAGRATSHLCAHGRGSDPAHTGWLQRFSNEPGSNASSDGVYLTGAHYVGRHGRAQRLRGLDPSNSNAEARAIVIHAAWYVDDTLVRSHGKIGRSEGCFVFTDPGLDEVLARLGPGRLLAAGRYDLAG